MSFFTGFITSRRWAFEEMFRGLKRNAGANAFAVLLSALALTIPLRTIGTSAKSSNIG